MYKFTIVYYYEKFTVGPFEGCTNLDKTRKAIVCAKDVQEAEEKIAQLDNSFIGIADGLLIEEMDI